jgi:hypothetical protein
VEKELNYVGSLKEDKDYFSKVCLHRILSTDSSWKNVSFFPGTERASFTWELLSPVFRKKREN